MKESSNIVTEIVEKHLESDDFEWSKLKQEIRENLSRYLFEQTKRRPVIFTSYHGSDATQASQK